MKIKLKLFLFHLTKFMEIQIFLKKEKDTLMPKSKYGKIKKKLKNCIKIQI